MKIKICFLFSVFFINVLFAQNTRKFDLDMGNQTNSLSTKVYTPTGKMPELVAQEWHNDSVYFLKYSADGKYLLSAADDIRIWDAETGLLIKTFQGSVYKKAVDFSPDGKYIAFTTDATVWLPNSFGHYIKSAKHIVICNIETEKIIFDEVIELFKSFKFSPNGKLFAIIADDKIDIYDTKNFRKKFSLGYKEYYFEENFCFSDDSQYISVIGCDVEEDLGASIQKAYNITWNLSSRSVVSVWQQTYKEILDKINFVAISPDNKYIVCATHDKDIYIHLLNKNIVYKQLSIKREYGSIENIAFFPNSYNLFCVGGGDVYSTIINCETETVLDIEQDGNCCCFSSARGECAIGGWAIWIRSLEDLDEELLEIRNLASAEPEQIKTGVYFTSGFRATPFYISLKNLKKYDVPYEVCGGHLYAEGRIFRYSNSNNLYRYIFETEKIEPVLPDDESREIERFFVSFNGNVVAYLDTNEVYIYDVIHKELLGKFTQGKFFLPYSGEAFSPDGKFLILTSSSHNQGIMDIETGSITTFGIETTTSIKFSPHDKYAYVPAVKTKSGRFDIIFDTATWKVVRKFEIKNTDHRLSNTREMGFSYDEKSCAFLVQDSSLTKVHVEIQDIVTGIVKKSFDTKLSARILLSRHTNFTEDGTKLVVRQSSSIFYYSLQTGELLATVMADSSGNWLTCTSEGYFTGNRDGINKFVHLVDGMQVFELGHFYESLYRPDLVAAKLRGDDISEENVVSLTKLVSSGDAPAVSFVNPPTTATNRDIIVNFSVQDMGGGVGSVYLKLNDKVIQLADGSRKFELVGGETTALTQSNENRMNFTHLLTLQNGENTIEAYATNAAGKIESRHAVAKISWNGSTAKPNLYVLSVGVNKYRDRSLWLNYAVPDAVSIAESFKSAKGNLYQSVNVETVFDGDVTKESLTAKFKELSPKVCADDVFVLFISGHGTISNKTGDYYFIPSNFRYTDSDALFAQGISKNDILGYMSGIQAQKSLIMLDTCNSGAFTNDSAARGFAEKSALERLVHATGQAVLTAASEEQSAMEGYEGHGIFTYVLLDALSGKADRNKDGYITLNELASYIEELVPELSYQKWGYEQVPMKDLRKQDFPLVGN